MLGIHDLGLFIASGLLLNMTPGPDSLLIMARSATQGFRAGSAAALGIGAGTCVHVLAAALGLSALLAASAAAFTVVKLLGAAYLVYLGIGMLFKRRAAVASDDAPPPPAPLPLRRIFAQGFLTNVLNPKVGLFFLAFVPHFISADAPSKAMAFVVLGAVFNVNGMLWCHLLAWSSAAAGARVRGRAWTQTLGRWLNRGIGALFLAFGVRLAMAEMT
ncbi:lysine transporter LysE [Roseateles aquatilis]|uniref:Lysine transporter LysE n=1 Tax=Roseateles aquatilis TaxID=431061 RepID=A0A246J7S6_9BURK|nr:LysE family translocator [Roseateles aquatilis]OWQ88555.1 lysine transporter LysE [Roseateles aquatilis]